MELQHKLSQHWTREDLQKLIDNEIEEGLYLEYKACAALQSEYEITREGRKYLKTKPKASITRELSKDVSAFANADGGTIIYGIIEDGHKPVALDKGFDPEVISKEWLEQVINSNIQRKIVDLVIHPVDMGTGFAYVVEIPKSPEAPHMAKDNRYYRRYNFQVLLMEEYEVREMLNRALFPVLKLHNPKVIISSDGRIALTFRIKNYGRAVAKYCDLIVHLEEKVDTRLSDEDWKDISGNEPRTKLRWSYERVIHPGLRISTPEIRILEMNSKKFQIAANLYAERMEMRTFIFEVDVTDIREPKVEQISKYFFGN